jgi:glutamate N-acetyltransferase/amino-acid N-acetyltransferase
MKPPPSGRSRASQAIEAAVQPIGQTIERALDPLAEVLKRAALRRADRDHKQFGQPEPAKTAAKAKKAADPVSPLAVPFPDMPDIRGVEVATGRAGLYPRRQRDDLLVMRFAEGTTCAGVFTQHAVTAAPVDWCKRHLEGTGGDNVRALVVNAGCANAFTGRPGADAARRVAAAAAKRLGCRQREVMLASTGVIGVVLDDAKVVRRLATVGDRLAEGGWEAATRAMMTTDTFPKGACAEAEIDGVSVRIAGITKGSGMIAPNMATMLAFIVTDAAISAAALQTLMTLYTRSTFNAVTVDGDRSTNDCCLLFATGKSGAPLVSRAGDRRLADFRRKLEAVMLDLATQLVRDGEGASKFVKLTVTGAQTPASARKIARTICESPLVKTALAGEDANWGRIVAAAGRADEPVSRDRLSIRFGELMAAQDGAVAPNYDEAKLSAYMKQPELEIAVDVGVGRSSSVMWTCDLTKRYVEINGDYRS